MKFFFKIFKRPTSVWFCEGERCDAVLVLNSTSRTNEENMHKRTKGNPVQCTFDNSGDPAEHKGCLDGASFKRVTMWYCRFCDQCLDPCDVPSSNRGKHETQHEESGTIQFTYVKGRPFVHTNCAEIERLKKKTRLYGLEVSHCFQPYQSRKLPQLILNEFREDAIRNGQKAIGLGLLGMGVRVPDNSWPAMLHYEGLEEYEKVDIIDRAKQFDNAINQRRSLLDYSPDYYVPGGASADREGVWKKFRVVAYDTRSKETETKASLGFGLLHGAGSALSAAALRAEVSHSESNKEGSTSLTCIIHYELYRLYLDPHLGSSAGAINPTFKAALASGYTPEVLEDEYGNRYVKKVYVGGTITIWMEKVHQASDKVRSGDIGVTLAPEQARVGAAVESSTKTNGPQTYDCTLHQTGGADIENKTLNGADMDQLLSIVDDWKGSIDRHENLRTIRVLTGSLCEFAHHGRSTNTPVTPDPTFSEALTSYHQTVPFSTSFQPAASPYS